MRILIVGAGATGGYLTDLLTAGGRDVTVLVHQATQSRLAATGLRVRDSSADVRSTAVRTVTADNIDTIFDLVIVSVRGDEIATATADLTPAVGPHTRVFSVGNGMAQLQTLRDAFDEHRVFGVAAEMATSMVDGVIEVSLPGVRLTIGSLDGTRDRIAQVAAELDVDGIEVTVVDDIMPVLWAKFIFITSTAVLTCLTRGTVGEIASAEGGAALADSVLDEVLAVVDSETDRSPSMVGLRDNLKDPAWRFGPSMFRDLTAGRRVEVSVLTELTASARRHERETQLLDAAVLALRLHNARLSHGEPA